MRASPVLLITAACGPSAAPSPPGPEVELALHTPAAKVASGEPVVVEVHTWTAAGWQLDAPAPTADGLRFTLAADEGPWTDGARSRRSQRYVGQGPDGSYVVQLAPAAAQAPGGVAQEVVTEPLFVDIGVPGPSGGPMAGLEDAPPPEPPPWGWALAAAAAAAVAGAAAGLVVARRRRARRPVPLSPQDRALAAWAAARASTPQGPALALSLSQILRALLEELSGWPATAHTSREILRFVADASLLPAGLQPRAARVLDATDLLKYAGEGGGSGLFDELDADLRAVVEATRRPDGGAPNA